MYSGKSTRLSTVRTIEEAERRSGERHSFTASAEVIELHSGARFSTRTTDLGHGGCFVDTMIPFPVGSKVHVRVHQAGNEFETTGAVVYSQAGLGMGVAFDALDPERRMALDSWIRSLTGEREVTGATDEVVKSLATVAQAERVDRAALVRLVQLLIGKGILTEGEGKSVLHDPVL
jgi:PilZ domain